MEEIARELPAPARTGYNQVGLINVGSLDLCVAVLNAGSAGATCATSRETMDSASGNAVGAINVGQARARVSALNAG